MGHIVAKESYKKLEERINRFPAGAPPTETLYKILEVLFSEKEAMLVSKLPIKGFTVSTAAKIWNMSEIEASKILKDLASRALLLDIEGKEGSTYVLPPPMAGFFEFTLMRTDNRIDQKLISELFHQYLNVEEDFIKELFFSTETKFGRVFVQEGVLSKENQLEILDYERVSQIIEESGFIGVSMCYCRHKAVHLGENCDAPMEVCMTMGNTAKSLEKHGYARKISKEEAKEIIEISIDSRLVQCGENVRQDVTFLCNCCGCCCEGLQTARKFGNLHPIETTGFLPEVKDNCKRCGKCIKVCPIGAIQLDREGKYPVIDENSCIGCGICKRECNFDSIKMKRRKNKILTPVNTAHRIVLMAIEKGKLNELIFDNKAYQSHRTMAAILGVILKLPLVKQIMASKQMKSVYLDNILSKIKI